MMQRMLSWGFGGGCRWHARIYRLNKAAWSCGVKVLIWVV